MPRNIALVYVRKSMVKSESDEVSPERQRAAGLAYCETRGWYPEIYEDAEGHRSGRSEEHRPEWRRLKSQLSRPDVAAVVVNSLDRASRSPTDFFNFLDELQKQGVELVSVTEQFDTGTAIGRAFLAILMVIASLESDMASERITATIAYKKSKGQTWGNPPFGYSRDPDNDMLLVLNDDAPTAIKVFELYLRERSFGQTAKALNDAGHRFRGRRGQPRTFDKYNVRSVISNVLTYAGYATDGHAKDLVTPEEVPSHRTPLDVLVEESDAMTTGHEPLITQEMANAALAVRATQRAKRVRRGARVYPLQPVLRCANCGSAFWGAINHGRHVYRHADGSCAVRSGTFQAEALEHQIVDLLSDLSLPDELREELRETTISRAEQSQDSEAAAEVARLRGKVDRTRELYLEGDIDRSDYDRMRGELQDQISALLPRLSPPDYDMDLILKILKEISTAIRNGSPLQQRGIITGVFHEIQVDLDGEITKVSTVERLRPFLRDLSIAIDKPRRKVPPREFECYERRGIVRLAKLA